MPAPRWQDLLRTAVVLAAIAIGTATIGIFAVGPAAAGPVAALAPPARAAAAVPPVRAAAVVPLEELGPDGGVTGVAADDPTDPATPPADPPTDVPTDPATPPTEVPPTTSGPIVESPTPPDAPASPPPVQPTDPGIPPVTQPTTNGLRVSVQTGDATLGLGYWSGAGATSFAITVVNTGNIPATVRINYTLPAGVTDRGTATCQAGSCLVNSLAAGTSSALTVGITVGPDAWHSAPLSGKLSFTASSPGADPVSGQATWGVLFPPGPPVPGINLQVNNVRLGPATDALGSLVIRLTDTGSLPATGVLDLVVPAGVALGRLPADCLTHQRLTSTTMECGLGTLAPAARHTITFQLAVAASARADAPLTGLVRVYLTPTGQSVISTQASYQITVPTDQTGVIAGGPASVQPDASARDDDEDLNVSLARTMRSPGTWAIIGGASLLLIVVAIGLSLTLRRPPPPPTTRLAVPGVQHGPGGWPRPAVPLRLRGAAAKEDLTELQAPVDSDNPPDPADPADSADPAEGAEGAGAEGAEPADSAEPAEDTDPDDYAELDDFAQPIDYDKLGDYGLGDYGLDDAGPGDSGPGDSGLGYAAGTDDLDDRRPAQVPAQPDGPLEPDGPIAVEWIELPEAPPPATSR